MNREAEGRIRPTQIAAIAVCIIIQMLDGMDVLVIAYAAPQIIEEWSITSKTYGAIFSAGLVGMTLGSVFIAPYADIIGRRRTVLLSVVVIAVSVILTAFTTSTTQMIPLRVLTGIGIGVCGATLTALGAEYAPHRYRDLVVALIGAGYAVGATLTGFVAAWLIPAFGWQAMFIAAGIATAVMLPVAFVMLPESLEFLLKRQPAGALEHANRIRAQLGEAPLQRLPDLPVEIERRPGVHSLLVEKRRRSTLGLWLAFFMSYVTVYFLLGWVPKIAVDAGLQLDQAIYAGTAYNLGGVVGCVLIGMLGIRLPLIRLIVIFQMVSAALMLAFGWLTLPLAPLLALTVVLGFFSQAGLIGILAASARLYPTEIRATGVGWAMGAARLGAIIGPYIGGTLMTLELSRATNFTLFAVPLVLAGLAAMIIRLPEYR